jgi:hypothetical protein
VLGRLDFTTRRFRLAFFAGQCALLVAPLIWALLDGHYLWAAVFAFLWAGNVFQYKRHLLLGQHDWLRAVRASLMLDVLLILMFIGRSLGTVSLLLVILLVLVLTLTSLAVLIDKQIRRLEQSQA